MSNANFIFRNIYEKPGPGVKELPPENGYKLFFYILRVHFWNLLLLNLIFIFASIPVVTLPAAFTSMTRVLMRLAREGICFLWYDFWQEFKRSFFKSFILGIIWLFVMTILSIPYVIQIMKPSEISTVALIAAIVIAIVFNTIMSYVFPLLALVKMALKPILINAVGFLFVVPKRSSIIIIPIVLAFLMMYLIPYTLPLFIFLYFSINQLLICVIVKVPIEKYAILKQGQLPM